MTWIFLTALGLITLGPLAGVLVELKPEVLFELFTNGKLAKVLGVTLATGFGGALVSLLIAAPLARQFARHSWRMKRLQRLMCLLPYLIPNCLLVIGYVIAWNPTSGLLRDLLPLPFSLYGVMGMTFVFGVVHMPVAFLLIEEKLLRIDGAMIEAAKLSGAHSFRIFSCIELPLLRPTIFASFILCFALNLSAFAIPAWLGAPAKTYPLTYKIYQSIQMGGMDGMPEAAAYSLILLAIALLPLGLMSLVRQADKKYALLSGKSPRPLHDEQTPLGFTAFQSVFFVFQLVFWFLPLMSLLASTLVKPGCLQETGLSCFKEITFRQYYYVLFELSETREALRGSFVYGTLSAVLILAGAFLILFALSRKATRLKLAEVLVSVPVATPGAIIALGLIVVASGKYGLNLYNTPWIVVAAYLIKHLNLSFQPLKTGLMQISSSLLEAAQLSGAGRTQTWRRVVFPILKPEIMGGFFLVLIPILGELTMSVFLTSPSFRSIGTVIFDLQDYADQGAAAALAILLVVLILILNEVSRFLSRGRLGY